MEAPAMDEAHFGSPKPVPSAVVPERRGLLAWLPFSWSQVLFPGRPGRPEATRLGSWLLLLILPGLLFYGSLSFPLFEPDEGRYAEIPREMMARGEWIVAYLQGEPYLDKAPLLYWLVRASHNFFRHHARPD